ncbi:MAG: exosortase system-associated protein, TIGR04073 family [Candidatus Omnitrophica bacterium]|nr:exosortase system-associated protein, TIGR04073 family [Candidatus Omnitrophota bacterium]
MRRVLLSGVMGGLIALALSVQSAEANGPTRKLGRGVANLFTAAFELPPRVAQTYDARGAVAALSWGILDGCRAFAVRTAAGAVEMATFLLPWPGAGYEPMVEPEFLLDPHDPVQASLTE